MCPDGELGAQWQPGTPLPTRSGSPGAGGGGWGAEAPERRQHLAGPQGGHRQISVWEADSPSRQDGARPQAGPGLSSPSLICRICPSWLSFSKPAFHLLLDPSLWTPVGPSEPPAGWLHTPPPPPAAVSEQWAFSASSTPPFPSLGLETLSDALRTHTHVASAPLRNIRAHPFGTSHEGLSAEASGPLHLPSLCLHSSSALPWLLNPSTQPRTGSLFSRHRDPLPCWT